MAEEDQPGKLFVGGLHADTNENSLEVVFGKYGRIKQVTLMKDREKNKSRRFAFITFENPAHVKDAAKDMNGKSLDGKAIKVEQANKPPFESSGKQRPQPPARNRGHLRNPRNPRNGRGGNGRAREHPSRGGHLGGGGYTPSLNASSSRGPFPVKRGPSSRSGGPPPKRSAQRRRSSGMGRQASGGMERRGRKTSEEEDKVRKMAEEDQPGKLFVGGLHADTNENSLEVVFGKYGRIKQVTLMKDQEKNKSRRFAFITFENPAHVKDAAKDMNGKSLDGKAIKVEQANKPPFESSGKQRPQPPARNRGHLRNPRNPRNGRGGNGRAREHPSRGGHLGGGGYTPSLNASSSRGPFPVKRGPSSRSGGPPPKRSAQRRRSSGMGRQGSVSRGRQNYGGPPHTEPVSFRRVGYMLPRDGGYATKDSDSSRDYPSSRDSKDYIPSPRVSASRYYRHSSSRNDHPSRRHSGRDGYVGSRGRDYSEYPSGSSYRDSYESYGDSRGAPAARRSPVTYGGSSYYGYSNTRDGYGEGPEGYSSSQSNTYSSGPKHGRQEQRGFPPSLNRGYLAPHESYGSSGCGASRGGYAGSQSEREG